MIKAIRFLPCILLLVCSCSQQKDQSRPPNFLIILSDDQAYGDFGFMGNDEIKTPSLDKLAEEGALYPNGYLPMSVCRPSLATFLTGLYPHQHGIHFNHPWPGYSKMKMKDAAFWLECRAAAETLIRAVPTPAGDHGAEWLRMPSDREALGRGLEECRIHTRHDREQTLA